MNTPTVLIMKYAVIFAAVLALALAAPQGPRSSGATDDSQTTVVRFLNDNNGLGNYQYTYVDY